MAQISKSENTKTLSMIETIVSLNEQKKEIEDQIAMLYEQLFNSGLRVGDIVGNDDRTYRFCDYRRGIDTKGIKTIDTDLKIAKHIIKSIDIYSKIDMSIYKDLINSGLISDKERFINVSVVKKITEVKK